MSSEFSSLDLILGTGAFISMEQGETGDDNDSGFPKAAQGAGLQNQTPLVYLALLRSPTNTDKERG
ncbi:hypothetical protein EEX84_12040 [Planococcus salinus]|uniref:Uncharacterized protein n=1 Tax=Planococcus salinus TaxID=1848460 RepID=A0A3M8P5B9_9BACL|nr:hypothetical protein EEX84_12040 [Planococcus salinus]